MKISSCRVGFVRGNKQNKNLLFKDVSVYTFAIISEFSEATLKISHQLILKMISKCENYDFETPALDHNFI